MEDSREVMSQCRLVNFLAYS